MRLLSICALVALGALTFTAAAAQAASPPKGDYGCTFTSFLDGTMFAGELNIKSKTKYAVNDEGKGRYTTRGKRINFKSGDYKGLYYGKWRKVNGTHEIKLYGKKDGEEKLVCTRDRA